MSQSNVLSRQSTNLPSGRYPFLDTATLKSDGGVNMSSEMFVDASVYPPGGSERQYVSRVIRQNGLLTVEVSDVLGTLCSGSCRPDETREIYLADTYGRPCGVLLGNPDIALLAGGIAEGDHAFSPEAAELVSGCVLPQPQQAVSGFQLDDGSFFTGDVWFVGKGGVHLQYDEGSTPPVLRVHAVGDPLYDRRLCGETTVELPVVLRRVRFELPTGDAVDMVPDANGNAILVPGSNASQQNILRIEPLLHGLLFKVLGNLRTE